VLKMKKKKISSEYMLISCWQWLFLPSIYINILSLNVYCVMLRIWKRKRVDYEYQRKLCMNMLKNLWNNLFIYLFTFFFILIFFFHASLWLWFFMFAEKSHSDTFIIMFYAELWEIFREIDIDADEHWFHSTLIFRCKINLYSRVFCITNKHVESS
jgi:hypothetical protein